MSSFVVCQVYVTVKFSVAYVCQVFIFTDSPFLCQNFIFICQVLLFSLVSLIFRYTKSQLHFDLHPTLILVCANSCTCVYASLPPPHETRITHHRTFTKISTPLPQFHWIQVKILTSSHFFSSFWILLCKVCIFTNMSSFSFMHSTLFCQIFPSCCFYVKFPLVYLKFSPSTLYSTHQTYLTS